MTDASGTVLEIATQVIEALGSIASGIQNMKILDLSKDYYKLYKEQKEFYYSVFHARAEVPLISEALSTPVYNINYAGRVATAYNGATGPFGGSVTDALGWWARKAGMYGDIPDPQITSLDTDMARIKTDWSNYLFRYEENYADYRNDQRWERRVMAHNVGLKQGSAVAGSLDNAIQGYQDQIQDFGNMLATFGNGVAKLAGYRRGIQDVEDRVYSGTHFVPTAPLDMNAYHMKGVQS